VARRGHEREGDDRGRRGGRSQQQEREKQLALWITLGVGGLFLLVILVIALSSGSSSRPTRLTQPLVIDIVQPAPPPVAPSEPLTSKGVAAALRTAAPADPSRRPRSPYRERVDKVYEAAKRRAEVYAKDGRWGKAIQAIEAAQEEFEELRFRSSDLLDEYNEKARVASRAAKQEAEKLFEAAKFDDAIKLLKEAAEKIGTDQVKGDAKRKIDEILQRKTVEAEANFVRLMTPVEQDIATWNFQGALDGASKLHFAEPEHQQQLEGRLERIRSLIDLRKKMCDKINTAIPRLTRKEIRVPGGVDGDLVEADQDRILAEGAKGTDQIPWPKFGPEATTNLALRAGRKDDPNYRITVARLLMEVGYFDRAKSQLAAAKKLGAEPTADEAELERRIQEANKAKEKPEPATEPKVEPKTEPKAETKGEPKTETKAEPKKAPKAEGK